MLIDQIENEEDDDEFVVVKLDNGEEVEVDFDSLFMADDD